MSIQRALELARTNYGRSKGWTMLLNGEEVATLFDPIFEDMFWFSYNLWPTSKEADALLRTNEAWEKHDPIFRSIAMDETVVGAYPAGPDYYSGERVHMRGLYLYPKGRFEEKTIEVASLWIR
ncbi:MAG: hypothetical protein P1V97_28090 [Planctomycetota bacterium]|nr:hypothetical protein [Planctomycetota bacterium]